MHVLIADIKIEIKAIYQSDLEPLFLPYQKNLTPEFFIHSKLVDEIKPIEKPSFMQEKSRRFYKDNENTILQVHHQNGLVKYQIKTSEDLTHQEILFVDHLNQTKSDMAYILISMCFLEIAALKGYLALHASALILNKEALLFSAPSKTGKSTHVGFYLDTFKHALILNDDKPLIKDGYVYGTPFSGKTFKNFNDKYPLKAIIFIYQNKHLKVTRLNEDKAITYILKNMLRPSKSNIWDKMTPVINALLGYPLYEAGLTLDKNSIYETYYHIYKESMMKLKEGFTLKEIGSKTMVIPVDENALTFNGILTINKSAKLLFESLKEEQTIDSLTMVLTASYEIDIDTARKDVITFIETLKSKDLLV